MDWGRCALTLLVVSFALPTAVAVGADPSQAVETRLSEISDKITVKHPASWTASPRTYPNARELVMLRKERARDEGQQAEREMDVVEARMLITSEPRRNHAAALKRLSELAVKRGGAAKFVEIGGWPAAEITFMEKLTVRGDDPPTPAFVHRAVTAIAAGDRIVRFDVTLSPGGSLRLIPEAQAIVRSTAFPTQGAPAAVKQDLLELDRKLLERRLQNVRGTASPRITRRPGTGAAAPQAAGAPEAAGGAPADVANVSRGELEIATSADAGTVVIASNKKVAFSTNRATTFTASAHGPFNPQDPTVARGASGNFYFGTLARPDGSAAHLNATGCTNAVSRSTDGGATFALRGYSARCPQSGDAASGLCRPDQPHIAADVVTQAGAGNDQLYAVWRDLRPTGGETQCHQIVLADRVPMMSCSSDGGENWTVGAPIPGAGDFPRVAVARDGSVFVTSLSGDDVKLYRFTSCASGFTAMTGYPVTVTTLTGQVACPMPGLDRCETGLTLTSPTVATDPANANHLFVAFAERDGSGGERVVVAESKNGGASFATPVTISDPTPARRFLPWACSTRGSAFVGWYDRRAALAPGVTNDLTDYFLGSARSSGGASPLVAGLERKLTANPDPQCATWPCAPRQEHHAESCSAQPQLAGRCRPPGGPSTSQKCDFTDGGCPSGQVCALGSGCPKYGDYNGIACAGDWVIAAWASGKVPTGGAAAAGIGVYASARYVGPYPLDFCRNNPRACGPPIGYGPNILRVKCTVVPCLVVDPIPRNCTLKWTCPGCPGGRCGPFYHVVFDHTLAPWHVDLVDGLGRRVTHEVRRVGGKTVLTVAASAVPSRDLETADYRLLFKSGGGIRPGVEYTIRARLETSDSAVLDIARISP